MSGCNQKYFHIKMGLLKDPSSFSTIPESETPQEISVFLSQKPDSLWFLDTSQMMLIKTNALFHRGIVCVMVELSLGAGARVLFELGGCLYAKAPHGDV